MKEELKKKEYEEIFNIDTLITEVKEIMQKEDFLLKGEFKGRNSKLKGAILKGKFEDNVWIMRNKLSETNVYFEFFKLEELKFKGINNFYISLIKCWVIETINNLKVIRDEGRTIEFRSIVATKEKLKEVTNFIEVTNNFELEFLETKKGSNIEKYFERFETEKFRMSSIKWILEYVSYIEYKVEEEKAQILFSYKNRLISIYENINIIKKSKQIPRTKDIFLFGEYIELFFKDKDISEEEKLYYMPILLWWKVTIIIPMRPSEFTRYLKRDALEKSEDKYYLKIDRLKSRVNKNKKGLPILKKIQITKEVFDLINKYIQLTDKYGESETLISYRAYNKMILKMARVKPNKYKKGWAKTGKSKKINLNVFASKSLISLIDNFYKNIIFEYYHETRIEEKIVPMDTRHIAFTSLMLQGFSPTEIAIIGGHTSLESLDNYICSTNLYIDSEVISIIRKNMKIQSKDQRKVIEIISQMPEECFKNLNECIQADIEGELFGYCTADFELDKNPCESDECYNCKKWWCEPSEYNFLKLEKFFKKKLIEKDNKLKRDLDFMQCLLKKAGLKVVDDNLVLDRDILGMLKRVSLELKSNSKSIINLKYKLVENSTNTYNLLSDLEELLEVDDIVNKIEESNEAVWLDQKQR